MMPVFSDRVIACAANYRRLRSTIDVEWKRMFWRVRLGDRRNSMRFSIGFSVLYLEWQTWFDFICEITASVQIQFGGIIIMAPWCSTTKSSKLIYVQRTHCSFLFSNIEIRWMETLCGADRSITDFSECQLTIIFAIQLNRCHANCMPIPIDDDR